jgi:hypothetical protein
MPRFSVRAALRPEGRRDSDLLDLKEYEGIRIVSLRVFLDLLVVG